jgi:hypothetical protein
MHRCDFATVGEGCDRADLSGKLDLTEPLIFRLRKDGLSWLGRLPIDSRAQFSRYEGKQGTPTTADQFRTRPARTTEMGTFFMSGGIENQS